MRPYIALAVAMVGSAMKNPSAQPDAIRRWVSITAASVLPAPVTSSSRWICGPAAKGATAAQRCNGDGVVMWVNSSPKGLA